ncbi:MAG: FlgD immunoglobulin-like domain containing protein, partial [Candidatus Krumholzibacteriia bacterium]
MTHLQHILEFLQNIVPTPTGFEPQQYANVLKANYPNPFNPTTTIGYEIKDQGHVSLKIYNAAGQLVRTLVNQVQAPEVGGFSVTWDGKNNAGQTVSSGVYFYKLVASSFTQTKKMVLLK